MTEHRIITGNSNDMTGIADKSVNLIVTSPPYPMIEMWDEMFSSQDPTIGEAIATGNGMDAFEKMHHILDGIWTECDRVLEDNCFICINIGDATRSINDEFQLYSNHTRIINFFLSKGYCVMPDIHWRKQSNAPNKFMGSGMYPAGAYVTYEHEYILVFRKGGKREFKGKGKTCGRKVLISGKNVMYGFPICGRSKALHKQLWRPRQHVIATRLIPWKYHIGL